ncbi:MAG TPA: hypothetical protein VMB34_29860 [Acetobacteraceae bacterium]|nr:hypothetical protein [Acetobacteraceae bacterium]
MKRVSRWWYLTAGLMLNCILIAQGLADSQRSTPNAGNNATLPLPTGLYVTPTAIHHAVLMPLNPNLQN